MINLDSNYDLLVHESEFQIFVTSTEQFNTVIQLNIPDKILDGFT